MIKNAFDYHVQTSYDRMDMTPHVMDWSAQPSVFKTYPGRQAIALLQDASDGQETLSSILERSLLQDHECSLDFQKLCQILLKSHTVTAKARYGGADFFYRSVASAGALYPFELYVAVHNLPYLQNGIYHHDVANRAITLLRPGDVFEEIQRAGPIQQYGAYSAAFFLTSIFFRSSWKYRSRAFRYHLLDTGHLAENLFLAIKRERLRFSLTYDFLDHAVNELLGLDATREVCLAVALVSGTKPLSSTNLECLDEVAPDLAVCSRVSARETDYPVIRQIHDASCKIVERLGERPEMIDKLGLRVKRWSTVFATEETRESIGYSDAVLRRRSMRNFVRNELSWDLCAYFINALCSNERKDAEEENAGFESVEVGLLIGKVKGLDSGFYLLDRSKSSVGLVAEGYFIDRMAQVCLDQQWLANCSIHFLFLSNFEIMETVWGPRGYRYAMLSAGRLGQRIYLGATSMQIGCCGIGAFYDAEAASLLGLNSQSRLLYLVGVGLVKKWSVGLAPS